MAQQKRNQPWSMAQQKTESALEHGAAEMAANATVKKYHMEDWEAVPNEFIWMIFEVLVKEMSGCD
jgi:hypothetical protein